MKILIAHNYYQCRGGEDVACESEINLLRQAGHEVIPYLRHNDEIREYSALARASLAWRVSWQHRSARELRSILHSRRPDIAHFHNTFPLISPSAYSACRAEGVPVVQTLHNFRLLCPRGDFFRAGRACQDCVSHSLARSVAHGCYRGSRVATAAVAGMLVTHRVLHTWTNHVTRFFVCSNFACEKFISAGFHPARIVVKPTFLAKDPQSRERSGSFALFLGRLAEEKGPQLFPQAWSRLKTSIPLEIAGDGPLRPSLETECSLRDLVGVRFSGWLTAPAAMDRLSAARFLVVPSICYEGFPMVIAEAYSRGVPVIAAGHGGLAEIVHHGRTGLHFRPGDPCDLAAKVAWAWEHAAEMDEMGCCARKEFEAKYSPRAALHSLESAYAGVLEESRAHRARHNSVGAALPAALIQRDASRDALLPTEPR